MQDELLARLATLVAKQGVALGGLPATDRDLVLAFAALALPGDAEFVEPQVNARLRQALAEELRFLQTDHVELRRWLVDTGHWQRDGYGRAYTRAPAGSARRASDQLLRALQGAQAASPAAWARAQRDRVQAVREARRRAHEDAQAARGGHAPS